MNSLVVAVAACIVVVCVLQCASATRVQRRVLEGERGWRELVRHLHAYELHDFSASHGRVLADGASGARRRLEVAFDVLGRTVELELERDDELFAPGYRHVVLGGATGNEPVREEGPLDCVYRGVGKHDRSVKASVVLCKGLVHATVFQAGGETFSIQPLESRLDAVEHVVYRHRDLRENPLSRCGNAPLVGSNEPSHKQQQQQQHNATRRRLGEEKEQHTPTRHHHHLRTTQPRRLEDTNIKYVGVAVVNDLERYGQKGPLTHLHSAALFAKVKYLYTLIGPSSPAIQHANYQIKLELQKMYTMTVANQWQQPAMSGEGEADSNSLLTNFNEWQRYSLPQGVDQHDVAHLYSGLQFVDSVVGLAHVGGACESTERSSVVQANTISDAQVASTSAHELGHNFGAHHTQETVPPVVTTACDPAPQGKYYIMSQSASRANEDWEPCSAAYFNNKFDLDSTTYGVGTYTACAEETTPNQFEINVPVCGNGLREAGEECDCPNKDCTDFDPCCNGATCLLYKTARGDTFDAACSAQDGACCIVSPGPSPSCTINPSNTTVCRDAVESDCDSPEYCTGTSAVCPTDVYAPTGTSCTTLQTEFTTGTCYFKRCVDPGDQCRNAGQSTWYDACSRNNGNCEMQCAQNNGGSCQRFTPPTYFVDGTQCEQYPPKGCYRGNCIPMAEIPMPNCSATSITDLLSINCGNGLTGKYKPYSEFQCPAGYPATLCESLQWFNDNPQIWGPIVAVLALFLLYCCCVKHGAKPPLAQQGVLRAQKSLREMRSSFTGTAPAAADPPHGALVVASEAPPPSAGAPPGELAPYNPYKESQLKD